MTLPVPTEPRPETPPKTNVPAPPAASGPPRLGVLLAILALIPPHTFWLVRVETELGVFGANMTDVSLFYTPVVALFLGALWSRWALRPAELAALYVALTLSAAFSGSDLPYTERHPFLHTRPTEGGVKRYRAYSRPKPERICKSQSRGMSPPLGKGSRATLNSG
jgi:hypothetical protein